MNDHSPGRAWALLIAEITAGASGGHWLDVPPWVGGALSALVVGVVLRVLDPSLRRVGERLARARHTLPPPPR